MYKRQLQEETTDPVDLESWLETLRKESNPNKYDNLVDLSELKLKISTLNKQQRQFHDDFLNRITADQNQFFVYISGEAGTGKSYLLNTLIDTAKHEYRKSGDQLGHPRVLVIAPSANAAYIVKGQTIHSAFSMEVTSNIFQSKPKTCSQLAVLKELYQNLEMVFIDEISMVGCNMLQKIHETLCNITGNKYTPFGGISIIATGDLRQLKPVSDSWIFEGSSLNNLSLIHI